MRKTKKDLTWRKTISSMSCWPEKLSGSCDTMAWTASARTVALRQMLGSPILWFITAELSTLQGDIIKNEDNGMLINHSHGPKRIGSNTLPIFWNLSNWSLFFNRNKPFRGFQPQCQVPQESFQTWKCSRLKTIFENRLWGGGRSGEPVLFFNMERSMGGDILIMCPCFCADI